MKDKKLLIIFSLITLLLIFSLSIESDDSEIEDIPKEEIEVEEDEGNEEESIDEESSNEKKDKDSKKLGNIYLEEDEESTYLRFSSEAINPITSLKWSDNNSVNFNYSYEGENGPQNDIYNHTIDGDKIDLEFNIEGIIWDWRKLDNNSIIYSKDGFNGLYYVDDKGNNKRITESQEWYNISPDGNKIIINGIDVESESKRNNRFIYNIDKDEIQKTDYIPDIDYVFSYLAATWSPDSTHIVSQIPKVNDQINIIDINKGIEKEIKMNGSILTRAKWSNDGEKLAFLVQSEEYKDYIFSDLETNHHLSNKVGIYDTTTKDIKIIDFNNKLTTSPIYWSEDSEGIIIETAQKNNVKELLESSLDKIDGEVQYINIDTKSKKVILEDSVDLSSGYPVHQITPIELFQNNLFIFMDSDTNIKSINIIDLGKEKKISEKIGYLYDYSRKDNDIFLISDEGIFTINEGLNINNIIDFKSYYGEDVLNVEVRISPNYDKAAFYVQYNQNSLNRPFIEIKSLF